ncbi:hypothetical protein C5C24_01730 [Rathayibacter sp. AY2B3]|uniref:hypothetical protein n=1 Tax=Rathayibacter sp. AY2B3 TaxID=2080569 RepID=UPI000CE79580|nr:hypothetical protein [Rathayibacter sp. AY2B3]PPG53748.1 hypothetical protein C5C24_01730 [Rathayibacter sp. AY2B3]
MEPETETTEETPEGFATLDEALHQSAEHLAEEDQEEPAEEPETPEEPRSEFAKLRQRVRDAEAETETLRGTVTALQRAEVERLASTPSTIRPESMQLHALHRPEDVWSAGHDLAEFLTDEGAVDAEKVTAALLALHGERGYLFAASSPPAPFNPVMAVLSRMQHPQDSHASNPLTSLMQESREKGAASVSST